MQGTAQPLSELAAGVGTEEALLGRILRVSRLQHGRAPYYHRLRDLHKRLQAVLRCCTVTALAASGSTAMAHAAIERALDAIPPPWLKLRHLLAQTYFMPFALAGLALLSRTATLLADMHSSLGSTGRKTSCLLLALSHTYNEEPATMLDKIFANGPGAASTFDTTSTPAANAKAAADDESDDLGEPMDEDSNNTNGTAVKMLDQDVSSLFFIDPCPAGKREPATIKEDQLRRTPSPPIPAAQDDASSTMPDSAPTESAAAALPAQGSVAMDAAPTHAHANSQRSYRPLRQHRAAIGAPAHSSRRLFARGSLLHAHLAGGYPGRRHFGQGS